MTSKTKKNFLLLIITVLIISTATLCSNIFINANVAIQSSVDALVDADVPQQRKPTIVIDAGHKK